MFDARFRTAVDRAVAPAGRALRRTGLSPDHLTAAGILLAAPAAVVIATGHLVLGLIIYIASALPDLFDGSLAKASGRTSRRGAFFDSVGDRVNDTVVLAGIAWYAQDRFGGHAALVPLGVLGVSQLVSYIRAKADALGIDAKSGLMERGERVVVICASLVFSAEMLWLLWVVVVLSCITAGQRFVVVWRQAGKPPAPVRRSPLERSQLERGPLERGTVALRWRAWREEIASRDATGRTKLPRAGTPAAGTRFFAGSRRPGRGTGRWHERRAARRHQS